MKRLFFMMAAVAAMVGCSKESNDTTNVESKTMFTMNASIVTDDTRVTVDGNNFTDVKWEQGDVVALSSVGGASATLVAETGGDTDVRFVGEGSATADADTYYAIYPATTITDGVANVELASQSGDDKDSAVLVAKAEGTKGVAIDMAFKPANALLHVAVSGVSSLSKAEFVAFDGTMLPQGFDYLFASETTQRYGEVAAYTIENPSKDGFFFSLPADLNMANGYVVRLTDVSGNVCSKAYNAKIFEKATTTRVNIEWSQPTVTLGAKTSYSYYLAGQPSIANSCANTDVFFVTGKSGESCASSYAGVQDAMISDLGYEVDGTTYTYSAGQVSWDKAANTFCINETPSYSTAWGEKSDIKAFVVVNDKKYYSTNNVWLTGLPYSYNFVNGSLDAYRSAGWSTNGKLRVSNETLAGRAKTLVLCHRRYSKVFIVLFDEHEKGFVVSPKFFVPATTMVQPSIVHSTYNAGGDIARITYVGAVPNTTSSNQSAISFSTTGGSNTGGTIYGANVWQNSFGLSESTPYISIDCNDTAGNNLGAYYFLHEAHFRYAE